MHMHLGMLLTVLAGNLQQPVVAFAMVQARTIDLCNNPKTKEPKLQAARRIIAEWPALDEEQANFTAGVDARFKAREQEFAAGAGTETTAAAAAGTAGSSSSAAAGADQGSSDRTEL
jgi:hypothetical protein